MQKALNIQKNGSFIEIGKVHYKEVAAIYASDVQIFAEQGAAIYGRDNRLVDASNGDKLKQLSPVQAVLRLRTILLSPTSQ